jgi:Leucine-rich repeat (LRR) protein
MTFAEVRKLSLLDMLLLDNNQLDIYTGHTCMRMYIYIHTYMTFAEIRKLSLLNTLLLDNNQLDFLPNELGYCTALTHISMHNNKVSAYITQVHPYMTYTHTHRQTSVFDQ